MLLRCNDTQRDPIAFLRIRERFLVYVDSFCGIDDLCRANLHLKRSHSLRVAALGEVIGRRIGLAEEEISLAKTCGLLHDVGRFEQFTRYRTFIDRLSLDHGVFGAELLADIPAIQHLPAELQEVVCAAVAHHNKAALPPGLEPRQQLHVQIVRDADKLDILHLYTRDLVQQTHALIGPIENRKVSPAVVQSLMQREVVRYPDIKSDVDCLLAKLAWVYDFNFDPSLQILQQRGYLTILKEYLPQTPTVETIFEGVAAHLARRLQQTEAVISRQIFP